MGLGLVSVIIFGQKIWQYYLCLCPIPELNTGKRNNIKILFHLIKLQQGLGVSLNVNDKTTQI